MLKSDFCEVPPPIETGCKDTTLDAQCACTFDPVDQSLVMECNDFMDTAPGNKLPSIQSMDAKIRNAFTQWPVIPKAYQKTKTLSLCNNKIKSIGDVSNLATHLERLDLSSNVISSLGSAILKFKELVELDLSYNLLDEFNFEDVVPNPNWNWNNKTSHKEAMIFSSLQRFMLAGNRIKQISHLDLMFVGMPYLAEISFRDNSLTSVRIPGLSQSSLNIIGKMKQAQAANSTFLTVLEASTFSFNNNNYDFSGNWISHVHFNFKALLSEGVYMMPYARKYMLVRFLSIHVSDQKTTSIVCDCGLYTDLAFLIESLAIEYQEEEQNIPLGHLQTVQCLLKSENGGIDSQYDLFEAANQIMWTSLVFAE